MSESIKLCDVSSVADGDIALHDINGREIAVARIGDEWFAIDDTCSHAKVSLSDGIVEDDDCTIECPKHGALFSLRNGEALTLPATRNVAAHATEVRGTEVWITLSEDTDS